MLPTSRAPLSFTLALMFVALGVVALAEGQSDPEAPAPTAGPEASTGALSFTIVDDLDRPLAGRLTFVGDHRPGANLFPNPDAKPDDLAVRADLIYSLSGSGTVTVPVGRYRVIASHGLEYSIDEATITISEGETSRFDARLVHEVDSTGWVSADFHLHTLTHSGLGDANMAERVISVIGEGLEVAVATDHNHHTDYSPTIAALGAEGVVLPIVGNEVSTPLGHFNAFPVDPNGTVFPRELAHGPTLFTEIRGHDSKVGVRTVIQVNHPRWTEIDYFTQVGLDPITGVADSPNYSRKFDSIEILNENACWGYYEAGVDPIEVGSGRFSVLEDWFNLLDRGEKIAAVGNSNSHSVRANIAGVPRNFVQVPTDTPAELEIGWIADAVRLRQVFTTTGPFVEVTVDGLGMGSKVSATDRTVELSVKVQAASWIDVDRVIVVINGDRVFEIPVPETRTPLRLETIRTLALPCDSWIVLLVEGDDSLAPVIPDTRRPIRPLAITNPIWVDPEGDGQWIPPTARAGRAMAELENDAASALPFWESASPANRRRLLIATSPEQSVARKLALAGLSDDVRRVRLAACRLVDRLDDATLDASLAPLFRDEKSDATARIAALTAVHDPVTRREWIIEALDREGPQVLARSGAVIEADLPGDFIRRWRVLGYFDLPSEGERPAPEEATALDSSSLDRRYLGRGGEIGWEVREARSDGYLDLLGLDRDPSLAEQALAYAEVWVFSEEPQQVRFTLGTDDGCLLFVNGAEIVVDTGSHGADPLAHAGRLPLRAGWNRILLRVQNGRGGFGAYLRILDDSISPTTLPGSSG